MNLSSATSLTKTSQRFATKANSVTRIISRWVCLGGPSSCGCVAQSHLNKREDSFILFKSFRRIFTGPSSVLSKKPGPSSKKRCNAEIIGLTQVTPQSIAYAAVQVSPVFVSCISRSHRMLYSGVPRSHREGGVDAT